MAAGSAKKAKSKTVQSKRILRNDKNNTPRYAFLTTVLTKLKTINPFLSVSNLFTL
jgi:hypothetical protein